MTGDATSYPRQSLVGSILHHSRMVGLFVLLGVLAAGVLLVRQLGVSTASVDLVASTDLQALPGLELDAGAGDEFDPQEESFYINHAYEDVSASVAGDAVVVTLRSTSDDHAMQLLQEFLDEYLAARRAPTLSVYAEARDRAAGLRDQFQTEVDAIDAQLAGTEIDAPARVELAVQRTSLATSAAIHGADAAAYALLADGDGPVSIRRVPAIDDVPLSALALSPLLALLVLSGLGVTLAWLRDGRRVGDAAAAAPDAA